MELTIVCACGQHNAIQDSQLESARCTACSTLLLRPVVSQAIRQETVTR